MFRLPDLPYPYDALSPILSEATLRTHHDKHHAKYVEITNALVAEAGGQTTSLEDVVDKAWHRGARKLFNNAAQALNHAFYWECMAPAASAPSGALSSAIATAFDGIEDLRGKFIAEGAAHFGSGWVWLTVREGKLQILTTHDGDTVMRVPGLTPLLVCDLWEHAYYLDHRNDRGAYLAGWWDRLVDWPFVGQQFEAAAGRAAAWASPKPVASERLSRGSPQISAAGSH
jgi:superoxide dismutase, Fe-Mn family